MRSRRKSVLTALAHGHPVRTWDALAADRREHFDRGHMCYSNSTLLGSLSLSYMRYLFQLTALPLGRRIVSQDALSFHNMEGVRQLCRERATIQDTKAYGIHIQHF